MQVLKSDVDVPIVGAAPSGLALAAALTRRGIDPQSLPAGGPGTR